MCLSESEEEKIRKQIEGKSEAASSNFGTRLKKIRLYSNMSQTEFAKILGVSYSTIGYYEKGKRTPDIIFLNKVIYFTGLSPYYLLGIRETAFEEYNDTNFSALNLSDKACNLMRKDSKVGKSISALLESPSSISALKLFYHYIASSYNKDESEKDSELQAEKDLAERFEKFEVVLAFIKVIEELAEINKKKGYFRFDEIKDAVFFEDSNGIKHYYMKKKVQEDEVQEEKVQEDKVQEEKAQENKVQEEKVQEDDYMTLRESLKGQLYNRFTEEEKIMKTLFSRRKNVWG